MTNKIPVKIDVIPQNELEKDYHLYHSAFYNGNALTALVTGTSLIKQYATICPAFMQVKMKELVVFSDKKIMLDARIYPPYGDGQAGMTESRYSVLDNSETIKRTVLNWDMTLNENHILLLTYRLLPGETGTPIIGISIGGKMISNNANKNTPYSMAVYGDSITWTNAGNSLVDPALTAWSSEYFTSITNKFIEDKFNKKIALITRSFGGTSASGHIRNNILNGVTISDISLIALGTNDCVQAGMTTSIFTENIKKIIASIKKENTNATVILCAPPSSNLRESSLISYRTALQTLFTSFYGGSMSNINGGINGFSVSNKIIYVDTSTAYNSTSDYPSKYSDTLHPNALGQSIIAGVITPVINACTWDLI
jgi:lysophospholipase L1-like esterase